MYTLEELKPLIIDWATKKNLIKKENANKQWLKLIEEFGELSSAILKNKIDEQKDAIGDVFVVLTIFANQLSFEYDNDLNLHKNAKNIRAVDFHINGIINSCYWISYSEHEKVNKVALAGLNEIAEILNLDLTECANIAWNQIKDRTGNTIEGTFIKD